MRSIIQKLNYEKIYIKRDDLLPFSFGGNKYRKARLFFQEIDKGDYDIIVTYGSSSSNHGRVIANMAKARGINCIIISPEESSEETFNSKIMNNFGAEIKIVPVEKVSETINVTLRKLKAAGKKPYFIRGGGHGYLGTKAYVEAYEEIKEYEEKFGIFFDYIFFASGTGSTHAGLVCGKLINNDNRKIIGISIARSLPKGRNVIIESIKEYLQIQGFEILEENIEDSTIFIDDYICGGYGKFDEDVEKIILQMMALNGIALDSTYTGKAFAGMLKYLKSQNIINKNILFIHTGGTPLFFDFLLK